MKRKNHWVLFAILLLALINLSPSNTSVPSKSEKPGELEPAQPQTLETEQEPKQLQVSVQLSEAEFLRLQQMNNKISEELQIDVDLKNIPYESNYASLQGELELGEAPDILLLNNTWIRRFAAEGYLSPTESYYLGSLTGELLSASLAPGEWNGYVWSVPMDTDSYVWVYHRTRIEELGYSLPNNGDEWMKLVSGYEQGQVSPYLFALDYSDPYAVLSLMWQLSGSGWSAEADAPVLTGKETEPTVHSLEALRPALLNLQGMGQNEVLAGLNEGKVGFALLRWSEARQINSNLGILYPNLDDPAAGPMWIDGRSYVVSAQSANKEAAGQWIAGMTDQLAQRQWSEDTGHLPVLKTIYYQATRNGLPSWIPASFVNGSGTLIPADTRLPEWIHHFSEIAAPFLSGEKDANTFLKEWSAKLN